ncbi:RIC7 [Hirschfeldia incana]|nr:RIC7 [Hirschfeldia incana]
MATSHLNLFLLFLLTTPPSVCQQQNNDDDSSPPPPQLPPSEQEAVYRVLDSVNSAIPWRNIFTDNLCESPPDGVVCDYDPDASTSVHVTELHLGYVSDYSQNPPCSPNATLDPLIFSSFKRLRKLFFYKCFTGAPVSLPETLPEDFGSVLEELVFIENPSLSCEIGVLIGNFTKLRRLVLTGNGFHGSIPNRISGLATLQEITLSRNSFTGAFPITSRLKNLKVLDFSHNSFTGNVPETIGDSTELLKLDLSYNAFSGEIPHGVGKLGKLEFLDLSYNRFGNHGVPLFLAEMTSLKEVYLSGNLLGGRIPGEIWKSLEGISGIGFSRMGLRGNIPASMGSCLKKSLWYLALDNNNLDGRIPLEFGLLESVGEINLENNNLTGEAPFSDGFRERVGKKLRLSGNPHLLLVKESDISSSVSSAFASVCFPTVFMVLYILIKQ